jgi:S1-C subfamily serine protease
MLIALTLALSACGGSKSPESQPTDSPKPTRETTSTPKAKDVNDLAGSVVMVAPGTLNGSDFEPVATGSGTIVDKSGLILTNYHVVDPNGVGAYDDIAIYVTDDPKDVPTLKYFGGLAAWDEELDLAVVRITENRNGVEIDPKDLDLPIVSIGDVSDLNIGDPLTVLGYPAIGGGSLELTKGAVSGFLSAEGKKDAWIKTDARIAPGNSGGGAFSTAGDLVGIPTAIYYVEGLGSEESGRIRPVDMAKALIKDAKGSTSVVIPKADQPAAGETALNVPLLAASDVGPTFVLSGETSLTNEGRASFYDNPDDALSFYEEHGRVGGIRRVFDDFDASDAAGTVPTVIVVQVDVYETADGAATTVTNCDEFTDTMWEFVTEMGFSFYQPEAVEGAQIGDETCLYSADEDVGSSDSPPLKLTFLGFRQDNALVVVGVFSLNGNYDFQTPVALAQAQSRLLGGSTTGQSGDLGEPTPEDALAAYLDTYGVEYVGDCDFARAGTDVGRYCSTSFDDRGSSVIYLVGPTFSEYDTWMLTQQYTDASWGVADAMDVTYEPSGDLALPPW